MNGMMPIPPKHACIAVVPGCVVIEPIQCLVYTHLDGHVSIDVDEIELHSEARNLSEATKILSSAIASAFACLSESKKTLSPQLRKKKEFLLRHLKQAT